jgi:hypothetical protein
MAIDKEQWEPMLETLFQLRSTKPSTQQIREAWCFDRQSHGDSGVLNQDRLSSRPGGIGS